MSLKNHCLINHCEAFLDLMIMNNYDPKHLKIVNKFINKIYYISQTKKCTKKLICAKDHCHINSNFPCKFGHLWTKNLFFMEDNLGFFQACGPGGECGGWSHAIFFLAEWIKCFSTKKNQKWLYLHERCGMCWNEWKNKLISDF